MEHPFDDRSSGKTAFPSFTAALQVPSSERRQSHDSSDVSAGSMLRTPSPSPSVSASTSALDWSIDTLATLRPMAFSPFATHDVHGPSSNPQQQQQCQQERQLGDIEVKNEGDDDQEDVRAAGDSATLPRMSSEKTPQSRSSTFFDDEAQYGILRTPASVIRKEQEYKLMQQQLTEEEEKKEDQEKQQPRDSSQRAPLSGPLWGTTPPPLGPPPPPRGLAPQSGDNGCGATTRSSRRRDPTRWRELHRQCVAATQLCEARVRERERKLGRLCIPASRLRSPAVAVASAHRGSSRTACPVGEEQASATSGRDGGGSREPLTPLPQRKSDHQSRGSGSPSFDRSPDSPWLSSPSTTTAMATAMTTDMPRLSFGGAELSPIAVVSQDKKRQRLLLATATPKKTRPARASALASSTAEQPFGDGDGGGDLLSPSLATLSFSSDSGLDPRPDRTMTAVAATTTATATATATATTAAVQEDHENKENQRGPSAVGFSDDTRSIAQRQRCFVAAMEEAHGHNASPSTSTVDASPEKASDERKTSTRSPATAMADHMRVYNTRARVKGAPTTSAAALYREARQLGISEPSAQWQYVELLSRRTPASAATSTMVTTTSVHTSVHSRRSTPRPV